MLGEIEETVDGPADLRGTGTIAWIELRPDTDRGDLRSHAVADANRQIERAVRADDRVCPVNTSTVVVQFGRAASVVSLRDLGDRLARAIAPGLSSEPSAAGLTVSVGMAAPVVGDGSDRVARRARSAARTSARALGGAAPGVGDATTVVTVDEARPVPSTVRRRPGHPVPHRRTVRRYGAGPARPVPGPSSVVPGAGDTGPRGSDLCVLVVDPMATEAGRPGFPTMTAHSVAEQLGCRSAVAVVSPDEPQPMTVGGADIDLVVLVLDGAWVGRSPNWAEGTWGLPARLTTAYVDKGTMVLAVSAGAGAGSLAACVAQGALPLFTLDHLADALRSLDGCSPEETRQVAELGFPAHFRALLGLTAGERRVLFYLTEGWGAQEIADELVVSLTTVRSHIRSVLRKLEVRSQLAAVAIANSRDLEHQQVVVDDLV
jgi:DNA-binding CsgD family transcriptional regulator